MPPEATPHQVADLLLQQFYTDLTDNPDSIPAHTRGSILVKLLGLLEKEDPDKEAPEEVDVLASLDSLPPPRQRELLLAELARLDSRRDDLQERLADLDGKHDPSLV